MRAEKQVTDYALTQESFTITRCDHCGLLFTNPRPAAAEIGRYYDFPDYVSHTDEAEGWLNRLYRQARGIMVKRKVAWVEKLVKPESGKHLLDYGCGSGYFLAGATQAGWQTRGVEPNEKARQQANDQTGQQDRVVSSLVELQAEREQYSVITMWHVLEHVHELHTTVQTLVGMLRPGGRVVVAVPNAEAEDTKLYGNHWAAYDVPRHLYHFNPAAIRQLWQQHGVEVIDVKPMPLDTYYVSLLSERFRKGTPVNALIQAWKANGRAKRSGHYSSLIYILKRIGDE